MFANLRKVSKISSDNIDAKPGAKPYYIVRLLDGLGNQLFQYAFGRKLAAVHGAEIYFDTGWFSENTAKSQSRPFALGWFDVKGHFGNDPAWSAYWIRPTFFSRVEWRVEQRLLPVICRRFVQQDPKDFFRGRMYDPRTARVRPGTYLMGWWLSPKYFEGIEREIRADLIPKSEPSVLARRFADKLGEPNAVAVHVRRGDYAKHVAFAMRGSNYYRRAAEAVASRVRDPRYFIFSDEPEAACTMLRGILPNMEPVVLEPGVSAAQDMWAMSHARHFINANSTFSWWGAWLSLHPEKTVIVPKEWFAGAGIEVEDVYPDEWIRVSTK